MKTIRILAFGLGMAAVCGLTSCSETALDETGKGSASAPTYTVSLNLGPKTATETRTVTGNGTDDGTSDEWMKSWTLVIVDNATRTVEKILTRPTTETDLVEAETYSVELTTGAKTVFALGNLTPAEAGITYGEGNTLTDEELSALKDLSYDSTTGNGFQISATSGTYLPMSNIVDITVTAAQQQSFDIPLYRMLAKVNFEFTSEASEDVKVTDIRLSPMTQEGIYLFPEHVNFEADRTDESKAPSFPTGSTTTEYDYAWTTGNAVAAGTTTPVTTSFYVNESKGSAYSQHLVFTLTTQRNGEAAEENYTLTDLSFINRNDQVTIPVVLTDYIFDPDIAYYPPIGGYPDVKVSDDKSYFVFYSGGGEFVLTPNLHLSGSTEDISPEEVSVTVTSDDGIFSEDPAYDTVDKVIRGELNGTTGTAVLTLSMTVATGTSAVEQTLTRKLYLVVE